MDNKDRENLICFLAKFQGGGEPSKDILSRYPDSDLISDVWIPLTKLLAEVEDYARDIAVNVFTGTKGSKIDLKNDVYVPLKKLTKEVEEHLMFASAESQNTEEMLYPFREDQKVLRIGVRSDETNSFDWLYEVRSSCLVELTDKGIDSILQFLSDRSTCASCFCEFIDGLDHGDQGYHGDQGDHYFLREYPNNREGRKQLRMMILCLLADLESGEDTEA
jgi:hypothetical protein